MSDRNTEVLDYLREQFARVHSKLATHDDEFREVKHRLSAVELGMASARREIAVLAETDAYLAVRVDKMADGRSPGAYRAAPRYR